MKSKFNRLMAFTLSAAMAVTMAAGAAFTTATAYAAEKTETATARVFDDGDPWIDYDLKENIAKAVASPEAVSVSAVNDYYLYADYDWLKDADYKPGYGANGTFYDVMDVTDKNARTLVTDKSIKGHDAELIQDFYNAYLDWDARNKVGYKPLKAKIKEIKKIKSMKQLKKFMIDPKSSSSLNELVGYGNTTDLNDSSSYIFAVVGDGFLLDDAAEYTKATPTGELYKRFYKLELEYILKRCGYTKKQADKMLSDTLAFEKKIASKSMTTADSNKPDYISKVNNVMSFKKVCKLMPNYPLAECIKADGYKNIKNVIVMEPAQLKKINSLYTKKNLEAIKTYMIVKYALDNATRLDKKTFDKVHEYSSLLTGDTSVLPDEEYAYQKVKSSLGDPLVRAYLEKYDAKDTKDRITKLINKIVAEYKVMLEGNTWLNDETKKAAVEKLDSMKLNVAYPDKCVDMSGLDLSVLSYGEMLDKISEFSQKLDVSHTNGKVDKELWDGMNPLETNAYYSPSDNSINILLGILAGDFYSNDMSDEKVYGGIGTVIGHEISHAFDSQGAQFDKNGNFANWWTEKDKAEFDKRQQKMVEYYNKITAYDGNKVVGENVDGEATADITGMEVMLNLAKADKDFDYDEFFRQFANIWKGIATIQNEDYSLVQDEHPLGYLRTNVTVQQFEEFYKTYDVKPGDKMYLAPEERIVIW